MRATSHAHLIFIHVIILIIFGEKYKLWIYSLRNFLQPLIVSSVFGPNIPLSTLFSNTFINIVPCWRYLLGITDSAT
jgi:hypothetical protein